MDSNKDRNIEVSHIRFMSTKEKINFVKSNSGNKEVKSEAIKLLLSAKGPRKLEKLEIITTDEADTIINSRIEEINQKIKYHISNLFQFGGFFLLVVIVFSIGGLTSNYLGEWVWLLYGVALIGIGAFILNRGFVHLFNGMFLSPFLCFKRWTIKKGYNLFYYHN